MKNLMKVMYLFMFVFILTKFQMGSGTLYFAENGTTTPEVDKAKRFETIGEAYKAQNTYGDDWKIENIG